MWFVRRLLNTHNEPKAPKRILDKGSDSFVNYRASGELVFVRDIDGYVEIPPPNEYIWAQPDIYRWTHALIENNVMCYYFDFTDP